MTEINVSTSDFESIQITFQQINRARVNSAYNRITKYSCFCFLIICVVFICIFMKKISIEKNLISTVSNESSPAPESSTYTSEKTTTVESTSTPEIWNAI